MTFYIYTLTTRYNTALYTGVTNNLKLRIKSHKDGAGSVFTKQYRIFKLVYFEQFQYITDAIAREKQIKGGSRKKKVALIEKMNPEWKELEAM